MSQQSIIDAAQAPAIAYGKKDWNALRASVTPGFVYDEIATHRKMQGVDQVLAGWKDWAAALPDSRATFQSAFVSGDTVVLELTWRGTHKGPLHTPNGDIAPTGKPVEIQACQVVKVVDGKAQSMRQYFDMATLLEQVGVNP